MLDIIATDDDDIYLTGDTHFDHGNISLFCHRPFLAPVDADELARRGGLWHTGSWKGVGVEPWKVSEETIHLMNEAILDGINRTVPRKGVLIHHGDFSMLPKSEKKWAHYRERCAEFRRRINCERVCIVWGNHDHPGLLKDLRDQDGHHLFHWSGTRGAVELKKFKRDLVCDHYMGAVWDKSHRGAVHSYGHTHSEAEKMADIIMPGRRSMDVGIDNAKRVLGEYRPFRLSEFMDIMTKRPGFSFNKHIPTDYQGESEG